MSFGNAPVDISDVQGFMGATQQGFIKNCRFAVMITPPRSILTHPKSFSLPISFNIPSFLKEMTFLCEAAELAGRSMQTIDARYYGPSFKMPYQSTYNDMSMTFLCRTNHKEKRFFDFWHNKINPNNSYNFEYRDSYATQINIYSFDETGKVNYQQVLDQAYPLVVNPINTTWADDQIARLNVIFTYKQYRTKEDPQPLTTLGSLINDTDTILNSAPFLGDPFLTVNGRT